MRLKGLLVKYEKYGTLSKHVKELSHYVQFKHTQTYTHTHTHAQQHTRFLEEKNNIGQVWVVHVTQL